MNSNTSSIHNKFSITTPHEKNLAQFHPRIATSLNYIHTKFANYANIPRTPNSTRTRTSVLRRHRLIYPEAESDGRWAGSVNIHQRSTDIGRIVCATRPGIVAIFGIPDPQVRKSDRRFLLGVVGRTWKFVPEELFCFVAGFV